MKEPIHFIRSHEGLKVYSGGKHVGTVPQDKVPYLTLTCAEQLANRPSEWAVKEIPPTGLADLLSKAIAEETATHAPRTTLAIRAMRTALEQLEADE